MSGPQKNKDLLVNRARCVANRMTNRRYSLTLSYAPSHMGIPGNELAGQAAAATCALRTSPFDIPFEDFRWVLERAISTKFCDTQTLNELHLIKPYIRHDTHAQS